MINPSDSAAAVKAQIEDAVALAGYSAPTSWADATDKINGTASQFERGQIADGMNGGLARDRINALFGGPVWAPEGVQLAIDFAANKAWVRNSAVTDSVGAVSLTRAGSVLMLGPNGYQSFPANTLARIDGVGAQVAPARTNSVPNSSGAGAVVGAVGSGGALPTGWAATGTSVSREVITLGTVIGLPKTDIRFSGSVPSGSNTNIELSATTSIPAANGQVWTMSSSLQKLGGNGFGVLVARAYRSDGSFIRNIPIASNITSTDLVRYSTTFTLTEPDVAYLRPAFFVTWGTDTTLDTSFRIAAPQLEEGSFATDPIITSGAAVSRPGDMLRLEGLNTAFPALAQGVGGVIAVDILQPSASGNFWPILALTNGLGQNDYTRLYHSSGAIGLAVDVGGSRRATISLGGGTWTVGRKFIAFAVSEGYAQSRLVGGALPAVANPDAYPSTHSLLGLGGLGFNSSTNNYQFTERLALNFGPQNADTFAQYWATAQEWAA